MDKSSLEALIKWLEVWSAIFGVIVLIGVAGESFFGIRLLWNNWKLQRSQAAESEALRAEIARLNNDTVQAKLALKQLEAKTGQRFLNPQKFKEALEGKPKGTVELLFKRDDSEAYMFAVQIWKNLDEAGWNVNKPIPIPSGGGDPYFSKDVPLDIRYGVAGSLGWTIKANRLPGAYTENSAIAALRNALTRGVEISGTWTMEGDPTLPDGHFIVVVGQKL
jgi:hypothetical protein